MIYLSAGHHLADPGAVANGYKEADLARELRDIVVYEIKRAGGMVVIDDDRETLSQYINRIKPGSGSVVCDLHFNASENASATGTECLYKNNANSYSVGLSRDISEMVSRSLGIVNRGAKSESASHRGRLGILHTRAGIACLPEICFITNSRDLESYLAKRHQVASCLAHILMSYDDKLV